MQSLRTIDGLRTGTLLDRAQENGETTRNIAPSATTTMELPQCQKTLHLVPNVLTDAECSTIVRTATERYGMQSIEHAYSATQRQSTRLCIVDEALAVLLWQRLSAIFTNIVQAKSIAPFGFYEPIIQASASVASVAAVAIATAAAVGWSPSHVNPCFRLSKYTSPSVGFTPHFDSQYCRDVRTRSIWTLLIYLNDVGETIFYDEPSRTPTACACSNNNIQTDGFTIAEEVKARGGLEAYTAHKVLARTGHAILFPHQVLHAGSPVPKGTKWILRSDVVFQNQAVQLPSSTTPHNQKYGTALEWFREAQYQELRGNATAATELYERALSSRKETSRVPSNNGQPISPLLLLLCLRDLPNDMWPKVMASLNYFDLGALRTCSHTMKARVARSQAIRRLHIGKTYGPQFFISSQQLLMTSTIATQQPLWMPQFVSRVGTRCRFRMLRSTFDAHPAASLRALAMYAFSLFGESEKTPAFIANYDAERQMVLRCGREWLIQCAFFELPCGGSWYHLHDTDAMNPEASYFPQKAPPKMTKRASSAAAAAAAGQFSRASSKRQRELETDTAGQKDESTVLSSGSHDKAFVVEQRPRSALRPADCFQLSVDASLLPRVTASAAASLDMTRHITESSNKRRYTSDMAEVRRLQLCGYSQFVHTKHHAQADVCSCSLGESSSSYKQDTTQLRYNNLICDFSKRKLQVSEGSHCGSSQCTHANNKADLSTTVSAAASVASIASPSKARAWIARLGRIEGTSSFNHASCQCGNDEQASHNVTFTDLAFQSHTFVQHVHIHMVVRGASEVDHDDNDGENEGEDDNQGIGEGKAAASRVYLFETAWNAINAL